MKKCPYCAEDIQDEARVCKHCGRDLTAPVSPTGSAGKATKRTTWLVLGLVVVLGLAAFVYMNNNSSGAATNAMNVDTSPPQMAPPPMPTVDTLTVYDGKSEEVVPYGGFAGKAFDVPAGKTCVLRGHVIATSGGNEDVIVYVLDDDQFINWKGNANAPSTFASPQQKATTLEVPLKQGHYQLIISNRFSGMTNKMAKPSALLVCGG